MLAPTGRKLGEGKEGVGANPVFTMQTKRRSVTAALRSQRTKQHDD